MTGAGRVPDGPDTGSAVQRGGLAARIGQAIGALAGELLRGICFGIGVGLGLLLFLATI